MVYTFHVIESVSTRSYNVLKIHVYLFSLKRVEIQYQGKNMLGNMCYLRNSKYRNIIGDPSHYIGETHVVQAK